MKVNNLKMNGISNPVGFAYPKVRCSWNVEETASKKQSMVIIEISMNSDFSNIIYEKRGENLSSIGENLEIELTPRTKYFYRITVEGDRGDIGVSEVNFFETGKMDEMWTADWVGPNILDVFHPIIFHEFNSVKKVKNARIYICGLGLYEAYLNGNKIGHDLLAPFFNDYKEQLQYQTYDITELIERNNKIEIMLGNGWYKGRLGYEGGKAYFGDRFAAIAEIFVEYADGSFDTIKTDKDWLYHGSSIEASDIYDGEIYNQLLWKDKVNSPKKVDIINIEKGKLTERYSLPVVVKEEVVVKEVITTPAGETVLDMGQNFTGYVEFLSDFNAGVKITLDFGEILQNGNFYNENYRTAKSQYVFISDGTKELIKPRFTFYGFRYVRVTGWPTTVTKENFIGKVIYSDLDRTGYIETSDSKINKLYENSLWGQKSNFLDMPTDCPQRDERLGWTGDAQVFAPTASYNMDTRVFYHKFLRDLRYEQLRLNGAIPNYLPMIEEGAGSSVWGDAATFIPFTLYEYYADENALENHYPMMQDWIEYITREDKKHHNNHLFDFGFHFGDWLALDGVTPQSFKGGTDDYFIASVYYYASVNKVAYAAEVLGNSDDQIKYTELASEIKQAIFKEFFTPSGRLAIDTQTAYIIALKFNVYMDKGKLLEGFNSRLKKDCFKIKGGFVGAPVICSVLAENDMEELAYHFLFQEEFPSWLHCVNLGATTIWERWNSVLDDGSISGTGMNSLNHYAYGSVMEFMYRHVAGIQPISPGFKSAKFAPKLNKKIDYVNCKYDSISGNYVSNWKINYDGTVTMHFEVPFNCTAVAILPNYNGENLELEAGIHDITYTPTKDYRNIFHMGSRLEELAKNKQAMQILSEKLPIAVGLIASKDKENLSLSLGELFFMSFMGFTPEAVKIASDEIIKIKEY